jgi:hypothetical protein
MIQLKDLAAAKLLPENVLRAYGLREQPDGIHIPYCDTDGRLLGIKRRTARVAKDGSYWERGKPLVPYGLDRLAEAGDKAAVLLVEGESDTWTCWYHDFHALGLPGADSVKCLEARHVAKVAAFVVHGDNDSAGNRFRTNLTARLAEIAPGRKVYQLHTPAPYNDLSDWYRGEVAGFLRQLKERIAGAASQPAAPVERSTVSLAELPEEAGEGWLWEPWLPQGALVVLDGDPGIGKSTVSLDFAARFTAGVPFPTVNTPAPGSPGRVLLLGAEDNLSRIVRGRLLRAGANLANVHVLASDVSGLAPVEFPEGWDTVERAVEQEQIGLVVIDPLMAFFSGRVDTNKDADVRRVLRAAAETADRLRCTILFVRHLNKAASGKAIYRGGGSIGIIGAARLGLLAALHPTDPTTGVLAVVKSNYGARPISLRYKVEPEGPLVSWLGEVGYGADDLVAIPDTKYGCRMALAMAWLRDYLSGRDFCPVQAILAAAKADGFDPALIYRAKEELNLRVEREPAFPFHSAWALAAAHQSVLGTG